MTYPRDKLYDLRLDIQDLSHSLREVSLADAVVVPTAAVLVLKRGDGFD